jgi:hypothetical protein
MCPATCKQDFIFSQEILMAFIFSKFSAMTKANLPNGKTLNHMQELCSKASAVTNPVRRAAIIKLLMNALDEHYTQRVSRGIMGGM